MWSLIRKSNDKPGAVLLMVLMLITILSALILSTLEMTVSSIYIVANHEREIKALYIADAGIEDAIKHLREDPYWTEGFDNKLFASGSYSVSIDASEYPLIKITSSGTLNDFQKRVESQVYIVDIPPSDHLVKVLYWKEI